MSTFVFRLKAPRPTFALDMSDEEREIMARHAEHWRPWLESGQMVIFGPVLDDGGSWGLSVVARLGRPSGKDSRGRGHQALHLRSSSSGG